VTGFWRRWAGAAVPVVEDLHRALLTRFLRHLHVAEPAVLAQGRSVVFLANHQTTVESTLFAVVASALCGAPVRILAKAENQEHWLERLMQHTFAHPALRDPQISRSFDRADAASLPGIIAELGAEMRQTGRSLMVHVEGTRALTCRQPVTRMSGTFIDLALDLGCAIVPVRFSGGLPAAPLDVRTEFPVGLGRQDLHLGPPLSPSDLRPLSYGARRDRVMAALNALGPPHTAEEPLPPDPDLQTAAQAWAARTGATAGHAVVFRLLERLADPSPEVAALVGAARDGLLTLPPTAEGLWMAELARRLFGPRGPAVVIDGAAS
jgi:1-acyl-sn-glycerol-3-phosphate acyltransferase